MSKIKFTGNGLMQDTGIHYKSPLQSDYTLCGITLDGDRMTAGDFERSDKPVNCADCKLIVNYCKALKP